MNQIEDQTSDSELTSPAPDAQRKEGSEFTRPEYTFKGVELWPFTYGYELLFNQVRDSEDTGLFTWLAFVFLLRKLSPREDSVTHRKWAVGLAWKVETFRLALSEWMDDYGPFTTDDKMEAKRIYEENMKAIAESATEPVPTKNTRGAQKKTNRRTGR